MDIFINFKLIINKLKITLAFILNSIKFLNNALELPTNKL